MDLGKEASIGETQGWPSSFMSRGVAHMLHACGPPHEYGDAPKMPTGLMHLFEELSITHCCKEEK